ncbi:MAG: hydroxymethylbilane synthase [Solirubrobacterales bacterium]
MTQARSVAELLGGAELVEASSDGEPGDKSRFVRAVERELLEGRAQIGVHSAKDLPADLSDGLLIAGVPPREAAEDAWVGVAEALADVPAGSRVGTSSLRRRAQLLALRPDLEVVELHGNVDTRLRKLDEGELDAVVLAAAGLRRLHRADEIAFSFDPEQMTPAAGQGALALQTRKDDTEAREAVHALSDEIAFAELAAERASVAALDASCNTPIGIHARRDGERIAIEGFAGMPDGSESVREWVEGDAADPEALGEELARKMLAAGAGEILVRAEATVEERATSNEERTR